MIRKLSLAAVTASAIAALTATTTGWAADKPVFRISHVVQRLVRADRCRHHRWREACGRRDQCSRRRARPADRSRRIRQQVRTAAWRRWRRRCDRQRRQGDPLSERFRFRRARRLRGAAERRRGFLRRVRSEIRRAGRRPARLLDVECEPGARRAAGRVGLQAERLENGLRAARQHHRLHQVAVRQLRHPLDRACRQGRAARPGHVPQQRSFDRRAGHPHHQPEQEARRDLLLLLCAGRTERHAAAARRRHQRADRDR